jgi:hypothetical protein
MLDNFKARFLVQILRCSNGSLRFHAASNCRTKEDETAEEFLDHCSVAMKTLPKVEDLMLQKFHYDQDQQILLLTIVAGLTGNPGKQVRFHMLMTADQALGIANIVFESEKQEKRNLTFQILKTTVKVEVTLGSPGRRLDINGTDGLLGVAQPCCVQVRRNVSIVHVRLTLTVKGIKGNCIVLSVENFNIFPKIVFPIMSPPERMRERMNLLSHREQESQVTYAEAAHRNTHHQENL